MKNYAIIETLYDFILNNEYLLILSKNGRTFLSNVDF